MGRARYSVRDEIKDTADCFYKAIANRNMDGIDEVWVHSPYAAVAGRSGGLHQGWSAVQSYWQRRFAEMGETKIRARLTGVVVHAVGDVAWLSGTEIRSITQDAETRQEDLRVTIVLERKSTGWQIVSYHASAPCATSGQPVTASATRTSVV